MQGLLARHSQLTASDTSNSTLEVRKDATTKLMETATNMMKNGVTPDVVVFIEDTIAEVTQKVLGSIVREHHRDQAIIDEDVQDIVDAVAEMQTCADKLNSMVESRQEKSDAHKKCRAAEALECAQSRKCEDELKVLWVNVKAEEAEMRDIHSTIYDAWCEGSAPDHPDNTDPFRWMLAERKEGPETSQTVIDRYPDIDLSSVAVFRTDTETNFEKYIKQKEVVHTAWTTYNTKLADCAAKEQTLQDRVEACDDFQIALHTHACAQRSNAHACVGTIGQKYGLALMQYNLAKEKIQKLEEHRKREWETLHIVTCLLETVYTRIIHSIETGEPCPTESTHQDQTTSEINECHIIPATLTDNLTIDYGNPPGPPSLPGIPAPPCTTQYLWDEHGEFLQDDQDGWGYKLVDLGLAEHENKWWVKLSQEGWAGCAAPRACFPCDSTPEITPDENYDASADQCNHGLEQFPGKLDMEMDSFTCLDGSKCISATGRCNGVSNCGDDSDELHCDALFGPANLDGEEDCHDAEFGDNDYQFHCSQGGKCVPMESLCNGYFNCQDQSDEQGCQSGSETGISGGVLLEPTTGFKAEIETPYVGEAVFYDRDYIFDSLGSFTGYSYIKMTNDDKWTDHSHIQIKLRLKSPMTIYVVKLDHDGLPWLYDEGWAVSSLEGVSYHGIEPHSRHNEWSQQVVEHHYGPGVVWAKTFTAGTVEMRGNNGGVGSYLIFLAHPENPPTTSFALWSRLSHEPQKYQRCSDNVYGKTWVADQGACQLEAISKGHPFYSFRHDTASHGEHECVTSDSCYTLKQFKETTKWHVYAQNDVKLGWAISSDMAKAGSLIAKSGATEAYDAYAFKGGLMEITVTKPSISGHVRLGMTTNSLDDHEYAHGHFIEFLPDGHIRASQTEDGHAIDLIPYKTNDFITLRLAKGKLSILKNGESMHTWDDDFGPPTAFAKAYFKEPETSLDVPGHQNNDPAASYTLGDGWSNECRTQDVSEEDCLEAAQSLLPSGQTAGEGVNLDVLMATNNGWSDLPPGCSVEDGRYSEAGSGPWTVFFNRNIKGKNAGKHTKVCKASRFMLGDVASNWCRTPEVGSDECFGAVKSLLPPGPVVQVPGEGSKKNQLQSSSWSHLPPGCSVQDGRYYRQDEGDWSAHWNKNDGNNDGAYTKICTKPPSQDLWTEVVVLSSNGKAVDLNMGKEYFNWLFSKCPVVKYTRNEDVHSVYVRKTPVTMDAFKLFTYRWQDKKEGNVKGQDFEIYDDEMHARGGVGQWGYCNGDDPDVGYPRDCGRYGKTNYRWFTMPGATEYGTNRLVLDNNQDPTITKGVSFQIYTGNDCPVEAFDSRLTAYWDYGSCGTEGDDFQNGWCGTLSSPQCPDTVATELCPSGEAKLADFNQCGSTCGVGTNELHTLPGTNGAMCQYFWHAQYQCV
jgi:hypothetical protein